MGPTTPVSDKVVGGRYLLTREKLGSGSFGEVYRGIDTTNGKEVAVKMENRKKLEFTLLDVEDNVYKLLKGGEGIPNTWWYGQEGEHNVLVMDLLGRSLEDLFESCSRKFSLKTICMLAVQMLHRLEYIHSKNYVHRDIKPHNFVMGTGSNAVKVFLVDFGLATFCKIPTEGTRPRTGGGQTGTANYASLNTHRGVESSRRDDLEAVGYTLIYFLRGSLLWDRMKASNIKQKWDKISEKKLSIPLETLCLGHPVEFVKYLKYCRGLGFGERPSYTYLRNLFRELLKPLLRREADVCFDWNIKASPIRPIVKKLENKLMMNNALRDRNGGQIRNPNPKVPLSAEKKRKRREEDESVVFLERCKRIKAISFNDAFCEPDSDDVLYY